ncbi:MAG TPA: hypothetical protein VH000_10415, partial [Rhizomicrobium sp.]|nr:hypothetical protein [Rhizomicrobium sp.]
AELLIFGPQYFAANAHPTLAQRVAHLQQMNRGLPLLYGLSFVMSPFLSGLGLGASACAYRALRSDAEPA